MGQFSAAWQSSARVLTVLVLGATSAAGATPPKEGASLTVGFESKPRSSDPRLIGTDANSQYVEELRFLPLFSYDAEGQLKPILAESYAPDGKQGWKIKLRKGLKFASGREVNAEDVVATYQFLLASPKDFPPSPRKGAFTSVTGVKKLSDAEVLFSLSGPDAPFLTNLVIGILPKEALSSAPEDLTGKGYESGPFVLASSSDSEWVLKRNDKVGPTPLGPVPELSEVKFKIIGDNAQRFAALVKGDLDLVQNGIDADKVSEIQKRYADKLKVETRTAINTTSLAFNLKTPAFQTPEARRAIAMAIKRDDILKYTLQGMAEKANGMFPPGNPFHDASLETIPYSPEDAMALLDKAGLKDPDGRGPKMRARFTIKVPTNKERIAVARAIAGQLKLVGLEVVVESLEPQTFSKQLNDGLVQAWISPWTGFKDPDHLHFVFHGKMTPPAGANRGFYSNAKVDVLLDKGREELDPAKRVPLYAEAQKLIGADLPYVFLWYRKNHVVSARNVEGFNAFADGRYAALLTTKKN